ncbi:hypothetical protein ACP70R_042568 [Stipagrostis hirtigluma subsp. patula]
MGCKASKHGLHGAVHAPEARRYSGVAGRHSVALRSSTLGTLSLDRAAAAAAAVSAAAGDDGMIKDSGGGGGGAGRYGPSLSFGGWCPAASPTVAPGKRQRRATPKVAPRTPTKTPLREPEEINVWELMDGLDDGDEEDEEEDGHGVERRVRSAPGSPVFDPDILAVFRKAIDELPPDSPPPDRVARKGGGGVEKVDVEMFPGIVRARVNVFQEKINAKKAPPRPFPPPPPPPPPPESARRVVVYLTSLRGVRQTYEDCWSTSAVLRGYGVRVDERDLSLHAGYKDELRAALGGAGGRYALPQVFADGRHLGGAEEVRGMHEAGELAGALEACEAAPRAKGGAAPEACSGCGGARFVPCDVCSGSCKVFVDDEDGAGAFRRCTECNENGLVRCPLC